MEDTFIQIIVQGFALNCVLLHHYLMLSTSSRKSLALLISPLVNIFESKSIHISILRMFDHIKDPLIIEMLSLVGNSTCHCEKENTRNMYTASFDTIREINAYILVNINVCRL